MCGELLIARKFCPIPYKVLAAWWKIPECGEIDVCGSPREAWLVVARVFQLLLSVLVFVLHAGCLRREVCADQFRESVVVRDSPVAAAVANQPLGVEPREHRTHAVLVHVRRIGDLSGRERVVVVLQEVRQDRPFVLAADIERVLVRLLEVVHGNWHCMLSYDNVRECIKRYPAISGSVVLICGDPLFAASGAMGFA